MGDICKLTRQSASGILDGKQGGRVVHLFPAFTGQWQGRAEHELAASAGKSI